MIVAQPAAKAGAIFLVTMTRIGTKGRGGPAIE